jgi:hypothetical protein
MAVLYNIACCHSNLGDARSGLVALSGCLELGFQDFDVIRCAARLLKGVCCAVRALLF